MIFNVENINRHIAFEKDIQSLSMKLAALFVALLSAVMQIPLLAFLTSAIEPLTCPSYVHCLFIASSLTILFGLVAFKSGF